MSFFKPAEYLELMGVTDEMIAAGEKALSDRDSGLWSRGGTSSKVLLTAVYMAMRNKLEATKQEGQ